MRRRIGIPAAGLAAAGAGLFAAMSLAGGGPGGEARPVAKAVIVAEPVTARPARGAKAKGKNKPAIDFFYSTKPTVPPEGEGIVQQIRCPKRAGNPIGAGARTSVGLVISYLSRANPQDASRPKRSYFVGVDDISDQNPPGSGALLEVQCAKGLAVGK